MKSFSVRHSDAQHLKVDDLMDKLGVDKSTLVRAALFMGLQQITEGVQEDPEHALFKVATASLKAK